MTTAPVTRDDVARALPQLARPAADVVRALATYRRRGLAEAAAVAGVSTRTVTRWADALGVRLTASETMRLENERRARRILGADFRERIALAYGSGTPVADLLAVPGLGDRTLYAAVHIHGVPRRGRGRRTGCPDRIRVEASRRRSATLSLAADGVPRHEIAARLGVSVSSVHRYLRTAR